MRRSLAVCGFAILLAGCGDDGGGSADTGGNTEPASMSDPASTGSESGMTMTMTTPTGATDSMSESSGGPACDGTDQATIDMCIMGAMAEPDYCVEVGDCNCESCACQLGACEADPGCSAIRECAQMTGCLGIMCLEPEFCMQVIEDAGGVAGPSGMIALMLSGCVEASMCPTQCEGEGTTTTGMAESSSGSGTMG